MNKDFENKIKSIIDKFKNKDFKFVIDKSKISLEDLQGSYKIIHYNNIKFIK